LRGPFLAIPKRVLNSEEFGRLNAYEVKLLIEIARQFNGRNNGDLSAAFSQLRLRGFRSPSTLQRAKQGLVDKGWLYVTRHGGKNRCSLYEITWEPRNDCGGKLECGPTTIAQNLWEKKIL
jgi:DNA-binding MarR family transcriptional regulator